MKVTPGLSSARAPVMFRLARGLAARTTPSQAVSVHCSLVQARTARTRSRPVMAIWVACVIASSAQSGASQPGVMAMMVLPPARACAATGLAHGPSPMIARRRQSRFCAVSRWWATVAGVLPAGRR